MSTPKLGKMDPQGKCSPRSGVGSDEDEVKISDLRPITSGGTSSSLPGFGAGEVTPHPDLAGEGGKRCPRTPVKQTPNARPRARARTEEWSNLQSGRPHGDSGGSSATTSAHPSETSSIYIRRTRSGRVPNVASNSGERAIVRRRGFPPACGLAQCGSTALRKMSGEGPCEDCGGGVSHTGEEYLCAACHRPSNSWKHLGPSLLDEAIAWTKACRATGAGLPRAVVKSFVPSKACLCRSGDCFFLSFRKFRTEGMRQVCIPCGAQKSSYWRTGGERARQYQLYFTGDGVRRTDDGMRKTKEVITAVSDICNSCHMAFYSFTKSRTRLPTTIELLAAPAGKELPQGIDRANIAVVRHMYEALAAGNMVCSEDIAVVLARGRRDNEVRDFSDKHLRALVSTIMKDVGEGVSDVRVQEYRGGTFGENGRTTFVYMLPTNFNVDSLVSMDRKLRRMYSANQDLCQQLQDARGNGSSGSGSATVTPRTHDERHNVYRS